MYIYYELYSTKYYRKRKGLREGGREEGREGGTVGVREGQRETVYIHKSNIRRPFNYEIYDFVFVCKLYATSLYNVYYAHYQLCNKK